MGPAVDLRSQLAIKAAALRILILAGTGFVGAAVTGTLALTHEVAVFHRGQDCTGQAGVRHIHGNRRRLCEYRAEFAAFRPDVVLDMVPQNADDATQTLEAARGIAGRVVGVSSGSVYRSFGVLSGTEPGPIDNRPFAEGAPLRSRLWPYRGPKPRMADDPKQWLDNYDKITAERTLLGSSEIAGSIIRLPMIYGPGDPDRRVGAYARRMLSGERTIPLQRTAAGWRNARAYLGNAAHGIALVVVQGVAGGVYNLAEPEDLTEGDWIMRIAAELGWDGVIELTPDGAPDGAPLNELRSNANYAQHLRMNTARIRRECGYAEPFDCGAGLRATLAELRGC